MQEGKNRFRKLSGEEMGRRGVTEYKAAEKHPVTLLLHNIRSMYNVGSMFRTADAAGIRNIVLSGYTATPERVQVKKTALGAEESIDWDYIEDPVEAIESMKKKGITIFGLEIAEGSRPYTSVEKAEFPLCLIMGNEVEGIQQEVLAHCDHVLEISQYGTKHSMNVAVSAGIALFELVRVLHT